MVEVHTGICGDHLGAKNLAFKIIRQGIFWPTMRKDCEEFVQRCRSCQVHGKGNHRPTTDMIPVLSPCPFFQWGIDIVGQFPKSKGQAKFIIVAVDYATKWVEAKLVAKIREKETVEFLMESIIFRFGIPRIIVTDNGTQFVGETFTNALAQLKIKHIKSSVAYPQANRQVEVYNRTILQGLKKRVEEIPRCWVDELPNVLWSYRTKSRSATGASPFRLAFGVEVVSPVEISLTSPRVETFDPPSSEMGIKFHNDLIEEARDEAGERTILYQRKTATYFNKKVKGRQFLEGDLVLREAASSQPLVTGKLKPSWEGPYKVSIIVSSGTYELANLDGSKVKNTWNEIHLKKFF